MTEVQEDNHRVSMNEVLNYHDSVVKRLNLPL